ncbi:MAG TPA: hypothetical protein VNO23_01585 [Candidatus Binatia bacterium]|nr:hypothetical protein [Candidatus Binatia bacterium]
MSQPAGRRREAYERLQSEIAREKAATLGRAGERLQAALDEAWALLARLEQAPPAERGGLLAAYRRARDRAVQARLTLIIQREAIGLRQHRIVDQQFPEPPRR